MENMGSLRKVDQALFTGRRPVQQAQMATDFYAPFAMALESPPGQESIALTWR
jgi:hypothetical protein